MHEIFNEQFWIAICFFIFLYFAYRPIRNAIISSLDSKIEEIKANLAKTEAAKIAAEEIFIKANNDLKEFEERKKQIIASSKETISNMVALRQKEIEISISRSKKASLDVIEQNKVNLRRQIRDEFVDDVGKIVRQYLQEKGQQAVDEQKILAKLK